MDKLPIPIVFVITASVFVFLGAFLFGRNESMEQLVNESAMSRLVEKLHYLKDIRTDICFAAYVDGTVKSLVSVSCEDLDRPVLFSSAVTTLETAEE